MSCLCYLANLIHVPVTNDSNELCIPSHAGVTTTPETSVVRSTGSHLTKPHLDRSWELVCRWVTICKWFAYYNTCDFEYTYGQRGADRLCMVKTDRKPESSSRYTLRLPANLSTVTLRRLLKKAFNHMQLVLCKHDRNDAVVEASWWLLTSVYFTHEDVAVPCNNTL